MNETRIISTPSSIGQPAVVTVKNPFQPEIVDHEFVEAGKSVATVLEDYDLTSHPTLVLLNHNPMLEDEWDTELDWGDVITLVREPGIEPITITFLVLSAISVLVTAYSLYTILTMDLGDPGDKNDSPNYSVTYQGNQRRPGEPIPVLYGEMRVYPDYSGKYSTYVANEQWLYQIFDITMGEVETILPEEVFYEDTPITNFSEYFIEQVEPGATSSIFPSAEQVGDDVSGIDLATTDYTPWYNVNAIGTTITEITFDVAAPQGLYELSDKGRYQRWSQRVEMQWRIVGTGTTTTVQETISYSPRASRNSFSYQIEEARYEARIRRVTANGYYTWRIEELMWERVRGTEPEKSVTETTRLAIKIRASNTLGNQSLSKLNIKVRRKLPTWNGSWGAPVHTKNAVWAFADACVASYGGKNPDTKVDLAGLQALESRGAEFNGIFDNKTTLWDALNEIARPMFGRAAEKPGGILSIVTDDEGVAPSAMYTMRNIIKDSFMVEHNLPADETINFVRVTYKNAAENYRETSVDCVPFGVVPEDPYEVRLRGVTDRDVAFEIGIRMANENLWRRKRLSFETGIEGFIPSAYDTIRVAHYQIGLEQSMPSISGEVRSNSGNTLTVWEDLSSLSGGLQCYLKDKDGSPWGPVSCSVGSNTISLGSTPPAGVLVYGDDHAGPMYAVGQTSDFMVLAKVTKVVQTGEHTVRIEAVADNPNAYIGDSPPAYSPILPEFDIAPKIINLFARLLAEDEYWELKLLWESSGADYHLIEMSTDSGVTWTEEGRTRNQDFQFPVPYLDGLLVQVKGVAALVGQPAQVLVNVKSGGISYPGIHNLHPVAPFIGASLIVGWDPVKSGERALLEFIAVGAGANNEVLHDIRLPSTTTQYVLTYDLIMSRHSRDVDGYQFPIAGARDIKVRLTATAMVEGVWQDSPQASEIVVINDQMGGLYHVRYAEKNRTLDIAFDWPLTDHAGVEVHMSTTQGFTPSPATLKYRGDSNSISLAEVLDFPQTYYLLMAGYDIFGPDADMDWSTEETISTTDDSYAGDVNWSDIIDDGGRPEDYADVSAPGIANADPNFDILQSVGFGTHWENSPNTVAWNDGAGLNGVQLNANGSTQYCTTKRYIECQKGDTISVKTNIYPSGIADRQRVRVFVYIYDKAKGVLISPAILDYDGASNGVWEERAGSYKVVSEGARYFRIQVRIESNISSGYARCSSLRSIIGGLQEWEDVAGIGKPQDNADVSPPGIINHDPNFDFLNTTLDWDYDWGRNNTSAIQKWNDGLGLYGVRIVPNGNDLTVTSTRKYAINGGDLISVRIWGQHTSLNSGGNFQMRGILHEGDGSALEYPYFGDFTNAPNGLDEIITGFYRIPDKVGGKVPRFLTLYAQVKSGESGGEVIIASIKAIQGGYNEWQDILDSEGKPVDNADVTRDNLGGDGVNRIPPIWASFNSTTDDIPHQTVNSGNGRTDTGSAIFGEACFRISFYSGSVSAVRFPNSTEFPIQIERYNRWIFSFWCASTASSQAMEIHFRGDKSGIISSGLYHNIKNTSGKDFTTSSTAYGFQEYIVWIDLTGLSDRRLSVEFKQDSSDTGSGDLLLDGLFLERMQSDFTPTLEDWSGFNNSSGKQSIATSHLVEDAAQNIYVARVGSDYTIGGSAASLIFDTDTSWFEDDNIIICEFIFDVGTNLDGVVGAIQFRLDDTYQISRNFRLDITPGAAGQMRHKIVFMPGETFPNRIRAYAIVGGYTVTVKAEGTILQIQEIKR